MSVSLQLCGLLLYALCSSATAQTEERVWYTSTTRAPTTTPTTFNPSTTTTTFNPSTTTTTTINPSTTTFNPSTVPTSPAPPQVQDALPEADADLPVVPAESLADPEVSRESAQQAHTKVGESAQDVLSDEKEIMKPLEAKRPKEPKKAKKPRKWITVSTESSSSESAPEDTAENIEQPLNTTSEELGEEIDKNSLNETDYELEKSISELLEAAEEGVPMVQETIVSTKTTIYVTISGSGGDSEPLYVNLTGIRDFTGQERQIVAGCMDLSDLYLTGEEAKEVIQRMCKQKFHRIDLSNNNIREFPSNTFSSVAFTVRELRLDGNPLLSNNHGEGSVLHRGGLFHLTELRELNLSSCGLQDMDFFTPWNSNHLELIDLSYNKLQTVPSNLQFFHKLKKLYIDGNPISVISELPFALLWNLQVLSISDCQVTSITSDPFRNMERLKELSLAGNNLTRINDVRVSRSSSGVKMYLTNNPWHCACDMLAFIEHYHYSIRDVEDIRCASPRWLQGLRTAYLTKEILSLDSVDGDCSPPKYEVAVPVAHSYSKVVRSDRLEVIALAVFVLAAVFMIVHVLWAKKKDKYKFEDDRHDINYIRIDKKPTFK